jgi:hypothetical protein
MKKASEDIKMYEEEELQKRLPEASDSDVTSGYKEELHEPVETKYDDGKTEDFYH